MLKILIVDDHEVVRQGLRTLLKRQEGFEVVGEAETMEEAALEAEQKRPDVVVMDVRLPDGSGVEACREIRGANPNIRVLMLTSYADDEAVFNSIMAGASGYLLKQIRSRELITAIQRVGNGESLLDPAVTQQVLARVRSMAHNPEVTRTSPLSGQEECILSLIAEGKTNREIAQHLFLSTKTVKNYVSNIFNKLDISRRAEAAAYYVRKELDRNPRE